MRNDRDAASKGVEVHLIGVNAVIVHASFDRDRAHKRQHQRALPASRPSDDANTFAGLDLERHILENEWSRRRVARIESLYAKIATSRPSCGRHFDCLVLGLLFNVGERTDTFKAISADFECVRKSHEPDNQPTEADYERDRLACERIHRYAYTCLPY